jgi:hypothetical protein
MGFCRVAESLGIRRHGLIEFQPISRIVEGMKADYSTSYCPHLASRHLKEIRSTAIPCALMGYSVQEWSRTHTVNCSEYGDNLDRR